MKKQFRVHEPSTRWQSKEFKSNLFNQQVKDEIQEIHDLKDSFRDFYLVNITGGIFRNIGYSHLYATPNYTYNYLYYANQLNYAWFRYVMNDGKAIRLQIADKQIETIGKFKNKRISSMNVLEGIQTALILLDKEALAFYANIPLEFTEQANQEDILFESLMLFYQLLIKGIAKEDEAHGAIISLKNLLNWDIYKTTVIQEGFNSEWVWKLVFDYRKRLIEHICLPVLAIYHTILNKNHALYERSVEEALQSWKKYYTLQYIDENKEERDHSLEPEGYIALPIIAACAYAYDNGMKLETIESDYIPTWMIEGEFSAFNLLVG